MRINNLESLPWNKKLLVARTLLGWTQVEAAERIGTSQKMIWQWETGQVVPRKTSRKAISMTYKVNYEELFNEID